MTVELVSNWIADGVKISMRYRTTAANQRVIDGEIEAEQAPDMQTWHLLRHLASGLLGLASSGDDIGITSEAGGQESQLRRKARAKRVGWTGQGRYACGGSASQVGPKTVIRRYRTNCWPPVQAFKGYPHRRSECHSVSHETKTYRK